MPKQPRAEGAHLGLSVAPRRGEQEVAATVQRLAREGPHQPSTLELALWGVLAALLSAVSTVGGLAYALAGSLLGPGGARPVLAGAALLPITVVLLALGALANREPGKA